MVFGCVDLCFSCVGVIGLGLSVCDIVCGMTLFVKEKGGGKFLLSELWF